MGTNIVSLIGQLLNWTQTCEQSFQQMKAIIATDVLLKYPDPNRPFHIETDASDNQLGSVIIQDNLPVAFFSRKLTSAQKKYPTIDKEMLSIVETFQEFRTILWGATIHVYTDHKNLTQPNLASNRILKWRMLIEEFSPIFHFKAGHENIVADTLSRYPILGEKQDITEDNGDINAKLKDCLLYYPDDVDAFPLDFLRVREAQQQDEGCMRLVNAEGYELQEFYGTELVCKMDDGQSRIVIPNALVHDTIEWYHYIMAHTGIDRLCQTIRTHLWIPNLRTQVENIIATCDACQRYKMAGPGYGHNPPRNETALPFEETGVDLIGPWKVAIPNVGEIQVWCLTMIDIATTLCEIVRIENKTMEHVAMKFENEWLSRYPRPLKVIHDPGAEFTGAYFQQMLQLNGIESRCTTVANPQANSISERLHSTIGDQLRTMLHENPPVNVANGLDLVDTVIASARYAVRSAVHRTLKVSPGALVFHRDMLLPIPLIADFNVIRARRQAVIDENNRRANLRRRFKDYRVNDEVLILVQDPATMQERQIGPFVIQEVHVNGTVTIQRRPNVLQRINIRRLHPYYRRN